MAWQVLTGVIDNWRDAGLVDVGRARAAQLMTGETPLAPGTIQHSRGAFVARRDPWRASLVSLDAPEAEFGEYGVTAWAADESWLGVATTALLGHPSRAHAAGPNESFGDLGLRKMLEPERLERFVPKPWERVFDVPQFDWTAAGPDVLILPSETTSAVSHYVAVYDAELDLLTHWSSVLDEVVVDRLALSQLAVIA